MTITIPLMWILIILLVINYQEMHRLFTEQFWRVLLNPVDTHKVLLFNLLWELTDAMQSIICQSWYVALCIPGTHPQASFMMNWERYDIIIVQNCRQVKWSSNYWRNDHIWNISPCLLTVSDQALVLHLTFIIPAMWILIRLLVIDYQEIHGSFTDQFWRVLWNTVDTHKV